MPEVEYQAFLQIKEMRNKYDYMQQFNTNSKEDIAKTLAILELLQERFTTFCNLRNIIKFSKI